MIKTLLATLLLSSALFGVDGYEVYKKNCESCHVEMMERFEMMPSLKGKLNAQEAQAVAEWLYNRYENIDFK
ncbi:putative periplasmic cytochrome c [Sulfurimonas gotlandica GD1]|uniref:Putative periplasmic cytochrome c n=1 Tax=Sulfurimonas gotlandica (strain DSM 19862 / JCM 16533 / GD1) TaxID=929558 RepID=B6BLB6_SULGG|nr:cytochrome c [Sulfurimonas gotlandica]EDZ62067.1 cytochrome c, putative [Sulfurimonas gotlandica GD1]EHP28570.1 putative periplasmic cytochrome c [Sulfurimonas gotlandica GD1]